MKAWLRKIIRNLVKVSNLDVILNDIAVQRKSEAFAGQVTNQGSVIFPEARVINLQNNSNSIRIAAKSYIRSELLVYGFGGEIEIGTNTYIGENTKIWSGKRILIGDHVLISHNVNIIDTNSHEVDFLERAERFREIVEKGHWKEQKNIICEAIVIEDYAWINFNVSILKGVRIGRGAIVAAGAVVTKDVEAFTIVAGNPAKFVKNISSAPRQPK